MGALRAAQFEYDNRMPPEVSETPQERAERYWIEEGIDQLMRGSDYLFQRRMRPQQGVTYERFALAVDEFAMDQLAQSRSNSALGHLVLDGHRRNGSDAQTSTHKLLSVADTDAALRQIAAELLAPFAEQGVLAQAEEAE
ncbi:hypothetical protein [Pseudomonas asiatica]|uniref:hypothetical protein n=1 Tax=Pseudomonas asiatica TaxID=2219225 RepID=UPI000C23325B|nr:MULTISPECIES: hypothetical protein [Pseudomonas]CAB5644208.1 Uncharacterised protein [Pseudomonas putida]MBO2923775.1 hypothetical protein [Pseudomonas asiatica]PJI71009.1 hypothetical protein CSW00_26120 [Pseudomonas sp. MR 02]WPU58229.1 hypothetical protein SQW15_16020 [Pseudomonas asiatica]CAB5690796.1 Uncharacterised protein [Pseudomonas putida]